MSKLFVLLRISMTFYLFFLLADMLMLTGGYLLATPPEDVVRILFTIFAIYFCDVVSRKFKRG